MVVQKVLIKKQKSGLKNQLSGGKLIGTGNYGAVIFPGIPCHDIHDGKHHVSKIFTTPNAETLQKFRHETNPQFLDIMKKIDPDQKRFIYCSSLGETCKKFKIRELAPETLNDLEHIGLKHDSIKTTNHLIYFNMPIAVSFGGSLNSAQKQYLFDSLSLLHSAGIAHCDIHMGNIMSSPGLEGIPKLIDFGEWQPATKESIAIDLQQITNIASKAPRLKKGPKKSEEKEENYENLSSEGGRGQKLLF